MSTYTAFLDERRLAHGDLASVVLRVKASAPSSALVFEDQSGTQLDFDLRGSDEEVLARLAGDPRFRGERLRSGPGRPKLGVVSREVSLLPRHWEWLEQQRGGASATLRKLVEEARKAAGNGDRQPLEAVGKFMWVMAGNLANFEEASRALYARDYARLAELSADWPTDIRDHMLWLLEKVK